MISFITCVAGTSCNATSQGQHTEVAPWREAPSNCTGYRHWIQGSFSRDTEISPSVCITHKLIPKVERNQQVDVMAKGNGHHIH